MVKLNLGCGFRHKKDYINIDNRAEVKPDLVCDITQGLPYKDNEVDEIIAIECLEHLERMEVLDLMDEIWRVLKHGGVFKHKTPSSDGRGAFQDPYHKSFWNINTWKYYFTDPAYRQLYGTKANFNIAYLEDIWTDDKAVHTHCIYEALKQPIKELKMMLGCIYNDMQTLNMILRRSSLGDMPVFAKCNPESAAKGLNEALDNIEKKGGDIAILAHQDIFFPAGWPRQLMEKLSALPDSWIVAGVWGIGNNGMYCGSIYDRRVPGISATKHEFPVEAIAVDECCIIVNMKSGFRFDEELEGFHLYGTYAALRAQEMGTAWVIDCPPEHYAKRPFDWRPDDDFKKGWEWLKERFPNQTIYSTVYREVNCDSDKLNNLYDGQSVWIIGKGPSLQYLKNTDIGAGPVIALNETIIKVEEMNLPNPVFSMQKDDVLACSMDDKLPRDCDKCKFKVRPKSATLLVHSIESRNCFADYFPRYIFDWENLGMPCNDFSMAAAVNLAIKMGCNEFNFISCDVHVNGNTEIYTPGIGIIGKAQVYLPQIENIKPYIEGLNCKWITPTK